MIKMKTHSLQLVSRINQHSTWKLFTKIDKNLSSLKQLALEYGNSVEMLNLHLPLAFKSINFKSVLSVDPY